jgi:histidinol dehydrogenase
VAGVEKTAICTPPGPEGSVDPASLVAADMCSIRTIYKVGGAQAMAAFAYGTETVPKVRKILGPGSGYVAAAKRLLYGRVDVGPPAGPSEAIILTDEWADPGTAALDLLIEAEHGPDSCSLLVTHCKELAQKVVDLLPGLIEELPEPRRDFCLQVFLKYGGVIVTNSIEESVDFANQFAPEHLELLVRRPFETLNLIKNAGEVLLGHHTPISLSNYSMGPNAILPTGGFAGSYSSVSVMDYLKRTSIAYADAKGFSRLKNTVIAMAEYEGFPAHARAVKERDVSQGE